MKIVAGIATTGKRDSSLKQTIASLHGQVDEIRVYDNSQQPHDYTDNAKFYYLAYYKEPIYFFSCDDDLIYPPDYIESTIKAIEEFGCIVTYHGRILRGKGLNYYNDHTALSCLQSFVQTHPIDVAGTGVTAFRTDYFNPTEIYKADEKRMSDLVFSLEATKQNKQIMHIGHKGGWIKHIKNADNIYNSFAERETPIQNKLADEIWMLKN